ncbi:MAG: hypothetical protein DDT29_02150 [Dehalococcoidia bacterium]|nr:hypothetical protein [Bacillota bacterium]
MGLRKEVAAAGQSRRAEGDRKMTEIARLVEDTEESGIYKILVGEEIIGAITVREDEVDEDDEECEIEENFYLVERLDIVKEHRGKGFGTQSLLLLKKIYGHYYIVPDSEGAQRLYDRVGWEVGSKEYSALDQGFGVYEIY